jgi:nucleotide-binding universal stress UspA family protein
MPTPEDAAMLQAAYEGLAEARRALEATWGVGRAELLASDGLRMRWRGQCARWSAAYEAAWAAPFVTRDLLAELERLTAAMRRGLEALDAAASEAGARPIAPWVWEVVIPGQPGEPVTVAAVVQTEAEAGKVIAEGRFLAVYTLAEIGAVLAALPEALSLAKQVWPGARFLAPRRLEAPDTAGAGPWRPEGDEIPFGDSAAGFEREFA